MAEFYLCISCDNAAFREDDGTDSEDARGAEVARILRDLANKVADGYTTVYLVDANSNHAGYAAFREERHEVPETGE